MSDPCPTCGGTGFELRTAEGGVSTAVRCACSYRERGAQLLQAARIPRRYDHCRFDNFELYDPGLKQPLAVAREWFERWPKQAYWTEIESWFERPGDVIEFTIRRLPAAD